MSLVLYLGKERISKCKCLFHNWAPCYLIEYCPGAVCYIGKYKLLISLVEYWCTWQLQIKIMLWNFLLNLYSCISTYKIKVDIWRILILKIVSTLHFRTSGAVASQELEKVLTKRFCSNTILQEVRYLQNILLLILKHFQSRIFCAGLLPVIHYVEVFLHSLY